MTKDYGIRPELYGDYQDMMSTVTKKSAFDLRPEPDSEFEKPYLNDDYMGMQNFHAVNYETPYLPPREKGFRAEEPEKFIPGVKEDVLMDAEAIPPEIDFEESSYLYMNGHDGKGRPWNPANISWSFIGSPKGIISGNTFTPRLDEMSCSDLMFSQVEATIVGESLSEGLQSSTIVKINIKRELVLTRSTSAMYYYGGDPTKPTGIHFFWAHLKNAKSPVRWTINDVGYGLPPIGEGLSIIPISPPPAVTYQFSGGFGSGEFTSFEEPVVGIVVHPLWDTNTPRTHQLLATDNCGNSYSLELYVPLSSYPYPF